MADQKPTLFGFAIVMALTLGSITYGYSFSIVSTTLGQPSWYAYFSLSQDPTSDQYDYTNSIIGTMNGIFSIGGCIGTALVAWTCDYFGRKKTAMIATPIAILGGAFQGGAAHIAMFIVGRLLSGIAAGMLVVLTPLFQSEIAPPAVRGFLVAQHGVIVVTGYSAAAWIGVACFYAKNPNFEWRFPLVLQALWPLLMLAFLPFIPESPRWLLIQKREQEAWKIVYKLYCGAKGEHPGKEELARAEFYQMTRQTERDRAIASQETFWTLFKKPSYRKRMFIAFLTSFAAESTGILCIYNYSVILYTGLGFKGSLSLILAAAYVSAAVIFNYVNSLIIDKYGRVRLLVIGLCGCLICLIFETALTAVYSETTNKSGLRAGVFFLFLYASCYGCFIDANMFVYCSEIFPTHIRSRGLAFGMFILFLSTIAYLTPAATAFGNVGWKYYLLFIVLTVINTPIVWYVFPETKGLSLEEIGEKFGDEVVVHLADIAGERREHLDQESFSQDEKPVPISAPQHIETVETGSIE